MSQMGSKWGIAYPMRPETNDTDALRAKFPSKRAGQP